MKNSQHFAEFIRGQTLDADQMLVSFDVVSLLTKIPVDLAIKVATNRLTFFVAEDIFALRGYN